MAEAIVYQQTGEPMRVGDKVSIRRRFWRKYVGTVAGVYDPSRPPGIKGANEYGFFVELPGSRGLWCGGQPTDHVELLERGAGTTTAD
jgi:hypothetical protein